MDLSHLNKEFCDKISQSQELFMSKKEIINGEEISIYGYRLSPSYNYFIPFGEDKPAFELRGLTFIGDKRNLMLHKFFNSGETLNYLSNDLKNKKIINVQDKRDGSMIRFCDVNGKILAKTKMTFNSNEALLANDLFNENNNIQNFIRECIDNGLAPIFELTSPYNRVVLKYSISELQLLQLRDEETGIYYDIYSHPLVKKYNIKCTDKKPELIEYAMKNGYENFENLIRGLSNEEGVVVTFEDGQMCKIKTDWYRNLHKLRTDDIHKTDRIVEMILTETIDDVIADIDESEIEIKNKLRELNDVVSSYMIRKSKEIIETYNKYFKDGITEDSRRSFAKENIDPEMKGLVFSIIKVNQPTEYNAFDVLKKLVLKETYSLSGADKFIEKAKNYISKKNIKLKI